MKNLTATIFKNTLSSYLRNTAEVLLFLALTPLIAKSLGTDMFGLWSLIVAMVSIFRFLDMGIANTVVKYIADARGKGEPECIEKITATFFWIYLAIATVLTASVLLFTPVFPKIFNIPDRYAHAARVTFFLIAFRSAMSMPFGLFGGILIGYQKQSWVNIVRMTGMLLYGAPAIAVLFYLPSIQALAWVNLLSTIMANLLGMALCMWKIQEISFSPAHFSKKLAREITAFSLHFVLIQISMILYMRVDTIVIQTFISLTAVACYTVASQLSYNAANFCRNLTRVLNPLIAELKGAGDKDGIRQIFIKGARLSVALAIPVIFGLFWFTPDLLVAWMGHDFSRASLACRILLAAMMIRIVHANSVSVLSMTGHQRFVAWTLIGGQMFNLALTLMLIHRWQIIGVAMATLVSTALADIALHRRAVRLYRLSFIEFYRKAVGPSVIPCGAMLAAIWLAQKQLAPVSLWSIALLETVACTVFAIFFILRRATGVNEC